MVKMKTIKINDNLFVNLFPVKLSKKVEETLSEEVCQNQYLIFDRSGSMYGYLDQIMDVAIDYCGQLPDGSTLSIGYFSGPGQYNLSVPYTLQKEITGVTTTLNSFRQAIGMTNFIEILNKVNQTNRNQKASLFFFTDGCHNTGGGRSLIEKELLKWKENAVISMFVGYGYIDRSMMSWMAETTNGSFVHLDKFSNFKETLHDFGHAVKESSPSIKVAFPVTEPTIPISISGKTLVEYQVENGFINFKPAKKSLNGVFFLTNKKPANTEEISVTDPSFAKGIRALALLYSQKNDANISLSLLSYLGDKYLIRNLYNSITPEEFSLAESAIRQSIHATDKRFIEGRVANYLPDPNAFCALDAINVLIQDTGTTMKINDPDFEYVRISKKTEQTDGPRIKFDEDISVSLNKIVMHKERLNVSVSTVTQGVVPLDPTKFNEKPFTKQDLTKLGLPDEIPVNAFRTYTLIADGKIQTKKLVVCGLSKDSIQKLASILTKRKDGCYVVDLGSLPVINRNYIKTTSAKYMAEKTWEERLLTEKISVLNFVKDKCQEKLGKKFEKAGSPYSKEAQQFLAEHYIKNDSYSPPVKTLTGDDEYEAYTFSISLKGFSKVSVPSVAEKIETKKKISQREMLTEECLTTFDTKQLDEATLAITENAINSINKELFIVRKEIQSAKFAVILANKGKMDEFSSRENMVIPIRVKTMLGKQLDVDVEFNIEKIAIKL
jgi:hypothetical protein